jgi:hypothetical protein
MFAIHRGKHCECGVRLPLPEIYDIIPAKTLGVARRGKLSLSLLTA